MVPYKKILWPIDFSEAGLSALPHVISLAKEFGSQVEVMHVAPDLADYGKWWGEPAPEHTQHLHNFAVRKAKEKMEGFCASELGSCSGYEIVVSLGDPATEILKAAERSGTDLIVMSSRGMSAGGVAGKNDYDGGGTGSVAAKVIRKAKFPVLVAAP